MILANHRSSSVNYGSYQEGFLFESACILNSLPVEPQVTSHLLEPTTLTLASAESPMIAICNSLSITNLFNFADPERQFDFCVISTRSFLCWGDVSRNLQIIVKLEGGHTSPAVSLRASSSFHVLPNVNCLRICISPAWWSHATSFTIVGLYLAGQLVDAPLLPTIVNVVHVNHAPSTAGRLLMASIAGDSAGIISAIKDGCRQKNRTVWCASWLWYKNT